MGSILCEGLIDGTGRAPLSDVLIEVEGERIKAIRAGKEAPKGEEVIDLRGYVVLPGIVDCHDHLGIDAGDEVAQAKEPLAYTAIKGVRNARQMLHAGITTLRDCGEQDHVDFSWRRAIGEGLMEGPDVLVAGRFITRTGGHGWFYGNEVDGPIGVRIAVRRELKAGADFIKIMITGGMSTPGSRPLVAEFTREEIAAAVDEAHRAGRKIAAHVHGGDGAAWAIEYGVDSIEHGVYLTEEQLAAMARRGIFLVATTGLIHAVMADPSSPPEYREKLASARDQVIRVLAQARELGVRVAIGGDTYHGHPADELATLISAGYTPLEAIRAATSAGAELCGLADAAGTIEPGKLASIIAVEGDPLSDVESVGKVVFVMKRGTVYRQP